MRIQIKNVCRAVFRMFTVDRKRLFMERVVMYRERVKMAREDVDWDKLQLQSEREGIRSQIVSWAIAKSEARAKVMSKTRPEAMPDLVSGARAKAYASACEDRSRSRSRTDSSRYESELVYDWARGCDPHHMMV